jgi:hypothetical protein
MIIVHNLRKKKKPFFEKTGFLTDKKPRFLKGFLKCGKETPFLPETGFLLRSKKPETPFFEETGFLKCGKETPFFEKTGFLNIR